MADDPVSALDVSLQGQILNLMLDLQADLGLSYLFMSRDLSVARYMSGTIGVLHFGRLVEVGPAREVYYRPVHPYTRGLADTGPAGELPSALDPPSAAVRHPVPTRPGALPAFRNRRCACSPHRAPRGLPLPAPRAGRRSPSGHPVSAFLMDWPSARVTGGGNALPTCR